MKLIDLLNKYSEFGKIQTLFPCMIETAKEVEVVAWSKEYEVADKNPQVIAIEEFYDILLKEGLITEEKYKKYIEKAVTGYASRTEGVAFIDEKKVSFRKPNPTPRVVFHELGHIHFREPDPIWSSAYGGGEVLFHLAIAGQFHIREDHIRHYHQLLRQADITPKSLANELAEQICSKTQIDCYPHLYALELYAGTIPDDLLEQLNRLNLEYLYTDLTEPEWEHIDVSAEGVRHFLVNTAIGLHYNDGFCINYARAIGIVGGAK